MSDINKWFANKCGVSVDTAMYKDFSINNCYDREIIREKFGISTISNHAQSTASKDYFYWAETLKITGRGKTISEAECNCITAIYEARDD